MKTLLVFALFSSFAYGKKCTYTYTGKSQEIKFVGYKFTDKTAVGGTFKDFRIMAPTKASSVEEVFANSSFWIDEMSLDAGKAARNTNIANGLLKNVDGLAIRGRVDSVDKKSKTLVTIINWGGKDHKVKMNYSYAKGMATAKGKIDLLEMGFKKGFDALGKLCKVWHKGKDGVVKTWSEVAIEASLGLSEKCI